MKLFKILETVLSEIGDASAKGYTLTHPTPNSIQSKMLKLVQSLEKTPYAEKEYKVKYVATIGENQYNIEISGQVARVNNPVERFTYLFNADGSKKPGSCNMRVDFDIKKKDKKNSDIDTNLNEPLKVLGAVFESTIHFVNSVESVTPVDQIAIYAAKDDASGVSNDSKRGRIYQVYANKNIDKLPDSQMWSQRSYDVDAIVLDRVPPIPEKKKKKK